MSKIKSILITTDFSRTSETAFPLAREFAEVFRARVILAYVGEDRLPPLILESADIRIDELMERHRANAEDELRKVSAKHFGGLEVETQVVIGTPHHEIVQLAEDRQVDLIVMATHGRGFVTHALLGSTTERVIRRAPCPVIVARDKPQEE